MAQAMPNCGRKLHIHVYYICYSWPKCGLKYDHCNDYILASELRYRANNRVLKWDKRVQNFILVLESCYFWSDVTCTVKLYNPHPTPPTHTTNINKKRTRKQNSCCSGIYNPPCSKLSHFIFIITYGFVYYWSLMQDHISACLVSPFEDS